MQEAIRKQALYLWLENFYYRNPQAFIGLSRLINPDDPDTWVEFVAKKYGTVAELLEYEKEAAKLFPSQTH